MVSCSSIIPLHRVEVEIFGFFGDSVVVCDIFLNTVLRGCFCWSRHMRGCFAEADTDDRMFCWSRYMGKLVFRKTITMTPWQWAEALASALLAQRRWSSLVMTSWRRIHQRTSCIIPAASCHLHRLWPIDRVISAYRDSHRVLLIENHMLRQDKRWGKTHGIHMVFGGSIDRTYGTVIRGLLASLSCVFPNFWFVERDTAKNFPCYPCGS